ncbi:MAG: S9 family peptidase [Polyangiaceae bacterium]|nr:S9 family peptidase [Polyangiaceae bacterium]
MQTRGRSLAFALFLAACSGGQDRTDLPVDVPTTSTAAASAGPKAPPIVPKADPSLPARNVFFGNPDRVSPQISPDGKWLAWLAPHEGVMNVWVAPIGDLAKAKVVTKEKKRALRMYNWTYTGKHLVYLQDDGGNENFHVFAVDVTKDGEPKDLTPFPGARGEIVGVSYKQPNKLLIGMNDRDKQHHDLYEVDVATAERKLVAKNEQGFEYVADLDYKVKLATKLNPDATAEWFVPDGAKGYKSIAKIGAEDILTTEVMFADKSGNELFALDSRGRDKSAIVKISPAKPEAKDAKLLGEGKNADVSEVLTDPKERTLLAYAEQRLKREWTFLDKGVQADFEALAKVEKGEPTVMSRTLDKQTWVVGFLRDDGPTHFQKWDRKKKAAKFLFSANQELDKVPLRPMRALEITARDGLSLPAYLTLPAAADANKDGQPEKTSPLVLVVHGGPWARDSWGYNSTHQWLASRGYAVLSVNYRGSTGFGKKFINAADKEWAGKMHDDLADAVGWAVKNGVADEKHVAIFGGSYGGYSALVGLTFTPKLFTCAVDIVGPSNLITLLNNAPPYWAPFMPMLTQKLADPKTEEGKKWLLSRSPLSFVDKIERPLLIGQGKNDPRVTQLESDQIVKAMKAKGIPVTYALYPDEGHGFARPENRKSFNAVAEIFLAQCLGGPYQPVGDDFAGSTVVFPEGLKDIPTLEAEMSKKKP